MFSKDFIEIAFRIFQISACSDTEDVRHVGLLSKRLNLLNKFRKLFFVIKVAELHAHAITGTGEIQSVIFGYLMNSVNVSLTEF